MPRVGAPGDTPGVRELLIALFTDLPWIAGVMAVVFGVVAALAFALPPRYAATTALLVLLGPEYTVRPEAARPETATSVLDRDQILQSETEILGSRDLHAATIRALGVGVLYPDLLEPPGAFARLRAALAALLLPAPAESDPIEPALRRFARSLRITPLKDGNVIEVTFRHTDPAIAAAAANRLVALYLAQRRALYADPQSDAVRDRLAAAGARLAATEDALRAYREANGISALTTERDLLLHRRDTLAAALQDSDTAMARLRAADAALRAQRDALPETVTAYADTDRDARADTARRSLQALQDTQADLLADGHPPAAAPALAARIAERERLLGRLAADPSPSSWRTERDAARDTLTLDAARTIADLAAAEATRATLAAQRADTDASLHRLDEAEPGLHALERARDLAEETYRALTQLAAERAVIEDVADRRTPSVRIIQPARPPARPGPLRLLLLAGAVPLALLAGAATALIRAAGRRSVLTPERLERILGLPVLATLPEQRALASWRRE